MGPRQTREALLAAVNAHDTKAIRAFVDTSYVARNESGMVLMDSLSLIDYAAQLFRMHPEYRESLVIDRVEQDGDMVRLATRRTETMKGGHYREGRQVETWMQREGRWVFMGEQAANPSGGGITWLWSLNAG
jgi:predicted SnoaL-like aldol condensation-catalyzing enzyme